MHFRTVLVVFGLFVLGGPSVYAQSDGLSDREYTVLTTFCLQQMNRLDRPCVMRDSTWTETLAESVLVRIRRTSSLARDFRRKNRTSVPLDTERVAKAIRYRDDRHSAFPLKGGQRFSRVGFSAQGDSALVQVMMYDRKNSYVLVRRRGDWAIAHTFRGDPVFGQ